MHQTQGSEVRAEMAVKERVRFGGRSARIQAEVHKAVKALWAETDRAELTVPMIAARAGVTPSTIYRRWGDLSALLSDVAVERLRPIADPDDTGVTATDLSAFVEQFAEEMSSPVGRALIRDVFANPNDTNDASQCSRFTREHLTTIADRATGRGEAPFDVAETMDLVIAPIMYRILFGEEPVTPAYCALLLRRAQLDGPPVMRSTAA